MTIWILIELRSIKLFIHLRTKKKFTFHVIILGDGSWKNYKKNLGTIVEGYINRHDLLTSNINKTIK